MDSNNLAHVKRFLAAMERGALGEELAAFLTQDVIQREFPNRLVPEGKTHDLASILAAAARGRAAVCDQTYRVQRCLEQGDELALELTWSGTMLVDAGPLRAGARLSAHYAIFFGMRDGKIASMRNYDCFEPF